MGMSGVSVDPTTHQIVVEDTSMWDGIIRTNPDFRALKGKQFPLYDDWCEIFEKDRVTGGYARDSGDIAETDDTIEESDEVRGSEDCAPRAKRNRGKRLMAAEEDKTKCYLEIRSFVHTLQTPVDPPLDIVKRLMEELKPFEHIYNLWMRSVIVSHLLDNTSSRQMWMILEPDTRKEWLAYLVKQINGEKKMSPKGKGRGK